MSDAADIRADEPFGTVEGGIPMPASMEGRPVDRREGRAAAHLSTASKQVPQTDHSRPTARTTGGQCDCAEPGTGICEVAPAPVGRYRTIVADPPWHYDTFGGYNGQPGKPRQWVERALPYSSMTIDAIAAMPVASVAAAAGANVFCWTTNRYLPHSFGVLEGWGVDYRQVIVWHKTGANPNTGAVAPTSCEFLLYGRIGAGAPLTGRLGDAMVETKRPGPNRHSVKPEVFLDRIEQVSPGPYLELFSRRNRLGWDTWGNESFSHVDMEVAS